MPLRCDICKIYVPDPWTITADLLFSCCNDKYKEKYGGRKYPDWYDSIIIIGDEDFRHSVTGCACVAHYHEVRQRLEEKYARQKKEVEHDG